MGASGSQESDRRLGLAVPKHMAIFNHRLLDPGQRACSVCGEGCFSRRHYCRRCGRIVCDKCTTMVHYTNKKSEGFRVCKKCNVTPITRVTADVPTAQNVWHLIWSYLPPGDQHRCMQACHQFQVQFPLSFVMGVDFQDFFSAGVFIAKGANGSVFRTNLLRDGRLAAVKVLAKRSVFSPRKWSHVIREIDVLQCGSHPHVIQLFDVFQTPDSVFIALELAEGGDLFDWLTTRPSACEADVKIIARQLLQALMFLHDECGIVHRDIKPENILLEKKVKSSRDVIRIKLADFGFARRFPEAVVSKKDRIQRSAPDAPLTAAPEVTVAATPCGTLGYAPPEVIAAYNARRHEPSTSSATPSTPVEKMKSADIFAAGVTIFILMSGCEPFSVKSSKAHVAAVTGGVTFDNRYWGGFSRDVKDLLRLMLSAKWEDRPSAFQALEHRWFGGTSVPMLTKPEAEATYREMVRSLRKHDGTVYVEGSDGLARIHRQSAVEAMQES